MPTSKPVSATKNPVGSVKRPISHEIEAMRELRESIHPQVTVKSFDALDLSAIEELDATHPDLAPLADIYQVLRATQYLPEHDPARGRAISVCIRIAHEHLWKVANEFPEEQ